MITATHKGKYYNVEYSIVNVSELEGELRIDAEYYDPFYLRNEEMIKKKKWFFLKEITYFYVNGDEIRTYYSSGIPYLRVSDIKPFFLDLNNIVYVHKESKIKESIKLEEGDILISRSGTLGISAMVDERLKGSIISSHLIRVKPIQEKINSYYLVAFLNSKYGIISILQKNNGAVVPEINHTGLDFLKIPIPSDNFQKFIEKLVLKAYEERQKAEQLYKQAEENLLEELGLKNWKPKTKKIKIGGQEFEEEENISIRMLSNVVKADRMDAEYWEPKYDEIEELVKNYKNGYSMVREEFLHKTDKLKINKDDFYNYVEISSVNTSIGDFIPSYLKGKELPANAKLRLEKGDLIVSKVRTYRKGIALIHKIYPNLIGSSAFVVLHKKEDPKINIKSLFVFLRTGIFSMWSYKYYTGTSYPTLTDEDILNLPIPLINPQIQQKISQLIQQSFEARENSKKLLEIAKRTVEIYIEKDEKEGLNYTRNKLNELNIEIN